MGYNPLKNKEIKFKTGFILLVAFIIIVPAVWLLFARLEGRKPAVILEPVSLSFGASKELSITATDVGRGLRKQLLEAAVQLLVHMARAFAHRLQATGLLGHRNVATTKAFRQVAVQKYRE